MNIYGNLIVLRALEPEDNSMLLELINDPETESMIGGKSWPVSALQQSQWLERQTNDNVFRCAIADRKSNAALGTLIINDIDRQNGTAQIHIKMAKAEGRGKGYGTDAIRTGVEYAFKEMRLHCIYAIVLSTNVISQRLFTKCGFKQEGILRSRSFKGGKYVDAYSYSILPEDIGL